MAVAFRESSVRDTGSAANITIPTGTVADDVIVVQLYTQASSPTLTGFTSLYNTPLQSGYYQNSFYRVATGSEGGNTVTCSATVVSFVAGSYSGGEFDSSAGVRADSGSTITSGTVTPSANDCMLVFTCGTWDADGSSTIAAPAGMTPREAPYVDWEPLHLSDELLSGGSGVGVTRSTPNPYVGDQSWTATLVSIKPVGGATVVTGTASGTISASASATATATEATFTGTASGTISASASATATATEATVVTGTASGTISASASATATATEAIFTGTASGIISMAGSVVAQDATQKVFYGGSAVDAMYYGSNSIDAVYHGADIVQMF